MAVERPAPLARHAVVSGARRAGGAEPHLGREGRATLSRGQLSGLASIRNRLVARGECDTGRAVSALARDATRPPPKQGSRALGERPSASQRGRESEVLCSRRGVLLPSAAGTGTAADRTLPTSPGDHRHGLARVPVGMDRTEHRGRRSIAVVGARASHDACTFPSSPTYRSCSPSTWAMAVSIRRPSSVPRSRSQNPVPWWFLVSHKSWPNSAADQSSATP